MRRGLLGIMLIACTGEPPKEDPTTDTATIGSTTTETTAGTTTETTTETTTTPNRPPSIASVSLTPNPFHEGTTVRCEADVNDPDGDEVSLTYSWQVNGETVSEEEQLTGASFDRGDEVLCIATPSDGELTGDAVSSDTETVANAPAGGASIAVFPTTVYEDTVVTCEATGIDLDGDPVSIAYNWLVNGSSVASGDTLTGASFNKDDTIVCEAIPSDPSGDGVAFSTALAPITVQNSAPTVTAVSVVPEAVYEDTVVACDVVITDPDEDVLDVTIDWIVNGSAVATGGTLTGSDFDRDDTVACEVTVNDGTATAGPVRSTAAVVMDTLPVIEDITVTPTDIYAGDTVSCEASVTDRDDDSIEVTYGWSLNETTTRAGPTVTSDYFSKGDVLRCVVVVMQEGEIVGYNESEPYIVQNTAPIATSVTITPSLLYENRDAVCDAEGVDADGDGIFWLYEWVVNGSTLPSSPVDVLPADAFVEGDTIFCTAYPFDDEDEGVPLFSGVELVLEACYDVDNIHWLSDDFDVWDADLWSSQPEGYAYTGDSLLVAGDAGTGTRVPMRSNTKLPIHRIEGSLVKDDNCSDHFLMLSPHPDKTWSWGSEADVLRFAWSCGFKFIYAPSGFEEVACPSLGQYDIDVQLTEDGVVFRDGLCPDVTLDEDWTDQDLYVYVGADQDSVVLASEWLDLRVYQQPHFEDPFAAWDPAVWDSQPARYSYSNDALAVEGGAETYDLTPHMRTIDPLHVGSIEASFLRLENCDDHFIMLSTSPEADWTWFGSPDTVSLAWNCDQKYMIGQTESFGVECPDLGVVDVRIDVDESSVSFFDGTCDPLTLFDDIGEDDLYVYIGGDQDNLSYAAIWLDLGVFPPQECAR